MIPISEHDFKIACKTGAIVEVEAPPFKNGHVLVVKVNWQDEKLTLFTEKKQPRIWANLNTLIRFLKSQDSGIEKISISLVHGQQKP